MFGAIIQKCIPSPLRSHGYLKRLTYARAGGEVVSGPFCGMKYVKHSFGSCYIPKLLGLYERELHTTIETAIAGVYPLILNVGAAEGYYAVGMARRCGGAGVIAYEIDARGQHLLRQMAALNRVEDRIDIRGKCGCTELKGALDGFARALVICDCEGFEGELLDPVRVPALRRAAILVEMHDHLTPGITQKLSTIFGDSHRIERIDGMNRSPDEYPYRSLYLKCLPRSALAWAVDEWRSAKLHWLWMVPCTVQRGAKA